MTSPTGLRQAAKVPSDGALNAGLVATVPLQKIQKDPCYNLEWTAFINKVNLLAMREQMCHALTTGSRSQRLLITESVEKKATTSGK